MFSEMFYAFGGFLDTINNYIQFFVVVFTILITLYSFMLPYIRPLKALLGSIGLQFGEIIKVLWLCYKHPRKYIRIYIELALISSTGMYQDKKWWRNFRSQFKKFIDDNQADNDYTATVNTSFSLAATEFNEKIKAYFDYFKQEKIARRFGIPNDVPVSFITHVEIDEGYIVPITFITGLNDRYDEDWVKILSNFFTAFGTDAKPETAILPEELYFTYNWLMWGPSYQNKYQKDKYKLIQYGYGDESNSVNVILDNSERSEQIWNLFCHEAEVSGEKKFGYNCSLKARIVDTTAYYKLRYDKIDIRSLPFLKRLSSEQLAIPFLVELIDFNIKTSHKAENYFFSAYLWIMFGLIDKDNPSFTPRKSVTFFEHANLADINNYNFLAESLIYKCFKHFDYIANHPKYTSRKYRFCLSMNTYIEKLFHEKLEEALKGPLGYWYKEHICTDTPFAISEILDTFDNYFVTQVEEVKILDVNIQNKESVKLLCNYYAETYIQEFKELSYKLTLDNMFAKLENKDISYKFHINLATDEESNVLGGIVMMYFPSQRCALIDSIAVHENHRNNNIGRKLLLNAVQLLRQDTLHHKDNQLNFIIAPINMSASEKENAIKLSFWENNNFFKTGVIDTHNKKLWTAYNLKESVKSLPAKKELEEIINTVEKLRIAKT